jgi:hypothetical protein
MKDFNPQTTVGALSEGVIITNLLFGVSTIQIHIHYRTFLEAGGHKLVRNK